ncbi:hypothetical protein [Notoacmeibacter ruber]|uniref:Uncharacterized protein n=1 Tax=Notoacmeibacter ruber TaxID=2670375 RepID=A0A3L7J893_9HYPH|nr:hypothetical protein [Notoacmeibacter ruber]RLQ86836.1 hypothetical protein D8780_00080 [Notoacmeibacter ruber]
MQTEHAETLNNSAITLVESIVGLQSFDWLIALRRRLQPVLRAHADGDNDPLFRYLLTAFQYQGMTDANVSALLEQTPVPGTAEIAWALRSGSDCDLLTSHWHFEGCGYRKTEGICRNPHLLDGCAVPNMDLRNGRLCQGAASFFLFVRDVCDDDLLGWIDKRLSVSCPDLSDRQQAKEAMIRPLSHVFGVSDKVLSLALSDVLLADQRHAMRVRAGASLIVVDTLVHNFLIRTGILRQFGFEHPYGAGCYDERGCATAIDHLTDRLSERDPDAFSGEETLFPRHVQKAIWSFCAQSGFDICNGNRIDDTRRCGNETCPVFDLCERRPLRRSNIDKSH